jgi:hypothetical protein
VQRWLALLIKNLNDPSAPGITTASAGAAATASSAAPGSAVVGKSPAVNLPTIPSGSSGAFGYSSVPLASANWNS